MPLRLSGARPAARRLRSQPGRTCHLAICTPTTVLCPVHPEPGDALREPTVAAHFVEVFLAKENHGGPVGINYLRKIELPIPFACYSAMPAGVDQC